MNERSNWQEFEQRTSAAVKPGRRPVAAAFLDVAPTGVEKFDGVEPSGCSFWRLAADGRVFYLRIYFSPGEFFNDYNVARSA
jgi:hypothetical protein